jgi:tRNA (cmo5U34)-methyltransferase
MTANGALVADKAATIEAMASRLPLLSPEAEVGLLEQAGFERPELFYAAFTFKGWVAYAGS